MSDTTTIERSAAPPTPARLVGIWILRAAVVYAALLAAWPLVQPAYVAAFRTVCDVALGAPAPGVRARFQPIETFADKVAAMPEDLDVAIVVRNDRTGSHAGRALDSRYYGYVPTVFLVALVLSTPLPWRRRAIALGWGLVLLQVLVGVRVLVYLLDVASAPPVAAVEPGPIAARILKTAADVLAQSTLTSFLLPLALWAALLVRPADFRAWFGADAERS